MDKAKLVLHAKDFMSSAMSNGKIIGATTVGIIAANEILDFKKYADKLGMSPDHMVIQHQGAIKAAGAMFVLYKFGKKMPEIAKFAVIGIGIQGAIQEARQLTGNKLSQVGDLDDQMKKAADEIKNMSGSNPTNEFPTNVAGMGMVNRQLEIRPDVRLMTDAMTTVAGMGAGAYSDSPFR